MLSQALMEVEVAQHLGAERYERSSERSGQRNGYRERTWDTRVGTLDLKVPRVRDGSYFPSLLEPRKRAERALVAVVREAYVQGVSTRRVDDLVKGTWSGWHLQKPGQPAGARSWTPRSSASVQRKLDGFISFRVAGCDVREGAP